MRIASATSYKAIGGLCFLAVSSCTAPDGPVGGDPSDGARDDRSVIDTGAGGEERTADQSAEATASDGNRDRDIGEVGTDDGGGLSDTASDGMAEVGTADGGRIVDTGGDVTVADVSDDIRVDGTFDGASEASLADTGAERGPDAMSDGDSGARKPSGVFGGGPFYSAADTVMPTMRASGFTTMVLWSIHVHSNGNLVLNDILLFSNGSYVGSDAAWPSKVASLKMAPTSVTRIEFSVGAAGTSDFEAIEALIAAEGTGPTSILYRNFQALKTAIPATDAINYDDESNYDVASTVALSLMLGDLGYKVTLCPYTNATFWQSVYSQTNAQRPGLVDRVLLQVYAGGASNNPATWSGYFGGLPVEAGLWSRHGSNCSTGDTPASVRTRMTGWRNNIAGGWMWLLDDMLACDGQYPLEDYATAINEALNP